MKRTSSVMIRLTPDEFDALVKAAPPGEELAAFARRTLLSALKPPRGESLRSAAAFIVAALSDHSMDEALALYDDNAAQHPAAPATEGRPW